MRFLSIIGLCVGAAVVYGIIHDQITARVCVEYFTVGHPDVFHTRSPTLLAVGWGVIATWWAGLMIGVPLAAAARAGRWPKLDAGSLVGPVVKLQLTMAVFAALSGVAGYVAARRGGIVLPGDLGEAVPAKVQPAFVADWCSHTASYAVGFAGGLVLIAATLFRRRQMARVALGAAPAKE